MIIRLVLWALIGTMLISGCAFLPYGAGSRIGNASSDARRTR